MSGVHGKGIGEVDNAPPREAVLAEIETGRETWSTLCYRIGWTEKDGRAQVSRLKRRLGAAPFQLRGEDHISRSVTHETAVAIVEALDLDPVDFGI